MSQLDTTMPATDLTVASKRRAFQIGRREQELIAQIIAYIVLTIGALAMILPFLWMVSTSFKPERGIFIMPPQWIPDPLVLENYEKVWNQTDLPRAFRNSAIIALVTTVGEVLVGTMAGFAFARLRFPGRSTFFGLLLMTMMIPAAVTIVPSFIMFTKIRWVDSFLPLIVPVLFGTPFSIFLSRQFFATLPAELEDAAKVDGANYFQIYLLIFLPLATPIIATLFVLGFIARWNDFLGPLIYLRSPELYTIPLELARLNNLYERNWTMLMSGSTLALLPIILLFFLFQRYFVESIAMTGIKG